MLYSQSPPLTAEETLFGGYARDPDVRSDQRVGSRRVKPSVDSSYPHRFGAGQPAGGRPSIGKRMFRTLVRFSIAVLIGVGGTLGWQSYGDEAREMLVAQAPALDSLLPVSTTKSPVMAATSTDTTRPLASTLDAVRRSVEQLAARQEQMAQNIAALRAAERTSSTPPAPPAPAQQAASIPQPKPPQPKIDSRLPPPAGPQFSR